MKRLISIVLAVVMSAYALVSCTSVEEYVPTNVTLASSDAYPYADWLTKRLGDLENDVILGIGSSEEYDIDMTDFEDDGYILRTVGDTAIAFGKTEDGLDRAVRTYANAVEAGTAKDLDTVYHEGYRIEKLTIAGKDISDYTIYYPADANANMKFAVSELQRLVEKASGVKLRAIEGVPEGNAIEFRFSDDPELKYDGYKYTVTESGIVFEGAVERGSMYAVWRFLQNECGWDSLTSGDSYLKEAEHIDIPAGTAASETPAFEHLLIGYWGKVGFVNERATPTDEQNSYGTITHACHGLARFLYGDYKNKQPCFNAEHIYEECRDNVKSYIEANYSKPGFKEIDLAQYDTDNFCLCSSCLDVYLEDGGHSGSVVRFANKLSEELNETYPGIVYKIFAYWGTLQPPKVTVPNEHVYITFCYNDCCSNHPYDGSECTGGVFGRDTTNKDYDEWIKGWCDISDNIYVWDYTLDTGLQQYTNINNIRRDIAYFNEIGVRGMYRESETYGLGIRRIEFQLIMELNWNPDMSEEEYEELLCTLLEKEYGAGWNYIREYIYGWEKSQDLEDCWLCWLWYEIGCLDARYNIGYYKENFDTFVEMFEEALAMADSAKAERNVELLYCTSLYMGCYSSYYFAERDGDTERMQVLSDRYDLLRELLEENGFDLGAIPTLGAYPGDGFNEHSYTIEEAAANEWVEYYELIMGSEYPDKE